MLENRFGLRFAVVVVVLSLSPALAMAYIDPGNGAYMVQALFTVVAAGIFYLRHPIQSLKALGRWIATRWKHKGSTPEASDGLAELGDLMTPQASEGGSKEV
jgi:hypothetical protein